MLFKKLFSALLYAFSSLFIVFANKIVLTTYSFPSFQILALGQLTVTLVGLQIAYHLKFVKLPDVNWNVGKKIMPLPILYFGNLLFGLGGTKSINLPMFTVLRRFSVLMTLYGELYILRMNKTFCIQMTIYLMVFGAIVAAYDDLAFDLYGYVYIMLNNIFTALNGIFTKNKLDNSNMGENGLLYYNALFTIFPMFFLSVYTGEVKKLDDFEHWFDISFWSFFILSSIMGFLLNYSCMLCTRHNSPLTTTVIGCLKNILVTYVGMFIGGDYIYSNLNFIGLTISAGASLVYSYLTFKSPSKKQALTNSSSNNNNLDIIGDNNKNHYNSSHHKINGSILNGNCLHGIDSHAKISDDDNDSNKSIGSNTSTTTTTIASNINSVNAALLSSSTSSPSSYLLIHDSINENLVKKELKGTKILIHNI